MTPPGNAEAEDLIARLERSHKEQIDCLRALLKLQEHVTETESIAEATSTADDRSHTADSDNKVEVEVTSNVESVSMLDEWGQAWTTELLQQRLAERDEEPECGGFGAIDGACEYCFEDCDRSSDQAYVQSSPM